MFFSFLRNGRKNEPEPKWFLGLSISSGCRKMEAGLIGVHGTGAGAPIEWKESLTFEIPSEISELYIRLQSLLHSVPTPEASALTSSLTASFSSKTSLVSEKTFSDIPKKSVEISAFSNTISSDSISNSNSDNSYQSNSNQSNLNSDNSNPDNSNSNNAGLEKVVLERSQANLEQKTVSEKKNVSLEMGEHSISDEFDFAMSSDADLTELPDFLNSSELLDFFPKDVLSKDIPDNLRNEQNETMSSDVSKTDISISQDVNSNVSDSLLPNSVKDEFLGMDSPLNFAELLSEVDRLTRLFPEEEGRLFSGVLNNSETFLSQSDVQSCHSKPDVLHSEQTTSCSGPNFFRPAVNPPQSVEEFREGKQTEAPISKNISDKKISNRDESSKNISGNDHSDKKISDRDESEKKILDRDKSGKNISGISISGQFDLRPSVSESDIENHLQNNVEDKNGEKLKNENEKIIENPLTKNDGINVSYAEILKQIDHLTRLLTFFEIQATAELLKKSGTNPEEILLISVWDPGIWIESEEGTRYLGLCDPALLAVRTGMNVLDSFPDRDLSEGGTGGPLFSFPNWIYLHSETHHRLLVDLGTTVRLSFLPGGQDENAVSNIYFEEQIPCGAFLDVLVKILTHQKESIDRGGRLTAQGRKIPELLRFWKEIAEEIRKTELLEQLSVFSPLKPSPIPYLEGLSAFPPPSSWTFADILNTAVCFISEYVGERFSALVQSVRSKSDLPWELILTGGGMQNGFLLNRLTASVAPCSVLTLSDCGIPESTLDALSTALLGILFTQQIPSTLPHLTEARQSAVPGRLTFGNQNSWNNLLDFMNASRSENPS